ncbi:MAG: ABC transporter ATP-binding protein [Rhodospirillaceae bacterium]|jgi:putative ABC transport system ATP-binding protein|nr:ABC transporter ATP-binding protein [Rhodospirillaceae bacterium]MBT6117754.1 ABC transporter ATP-binding protein [Rhodospirillaceae bacterium]
MDQSVYGFILRHSKKEQIVLLVMTVISYPFLYFSYDLPKQIINHITAVDGLKNGGSGKPYLEQELIGLFTMEHVPYLFALCAIFFVLVLINGGFKYFINVFKGQLGERMLRRMRYELYSRILRFPLPQFKKVSAGELIPMVTAEVEPLGGFIGDAFVQPIFQGGLLIVPLFFIFNQDVFLGLAAVMMYPVQGYVIPKLQRKVNALGKRRVRAVRRLSDRIGETINGLQEIHANDTSTLERAEFSDRLGLIYSIRYRIYALKFATKFLINAIDKMTPFFFYTIGGYLVIEGQVNIGALVAVIAAQKDLASPAKELLAYYQQKEDIRIKYEQVIGQFDPPGIMDIAKQEEEPSEVGPLKGELELSNLSYAEDDGVRLIDNATAKMPLDKRIAVVGDGSSGKDELAMILDGLLTPTGGRATIGGAVIADLPETVTGRRMAFVSQGAQVFSASVRDNLLYGLKHRPQRDVLEGEALEERRYVAAESTRSGNSPLDIQSDWIDYEAAGVDGPAALTARMIEVLRSVTMEHDVYQMGLRGSIDAASRPDVAEAILKARKAFRERMDENAELAALVEPFDVARYNTNATVAENLLFGTPVDETFAEASLATNAYVLEVLEKAELTKDLLESGRQMAQTMVELFSGLPPGHEFFDQFSFISSEDLPEFQTLLGRVNKTGLDELDGEDRARLLSLPFMLIPARHRLGLIDEAMEGKILAARKLFAEGLPEALQGAIEFLDAERYAGAATIQDNILFGKAVYGQAGGAERIGEAITELLDALDLRGAVMEVGLEFNAGIGGSRLSGAQRQKIAIARGLIKRPDILIIDQATAILDGQTQSSIMSNLLEMYSEGGLIWFLHRPSLAQSFDHVVVMKAGRVAEDGSYADLSGDDTALKALIEAE